MNQAEVDDVVSMIIFICTSGQEDKAFGEGFLRSIRVLECGEHEISKARRTRASLFNELIQRTTSVVFDGEERYRLIGIPYNALRIFKNITELGFKSQQLSDECLGRIEEELCSLEKLERLYLQKNRLTRLPSLCKFEKIKEIHLDAKEIGEEGIRNFILQGGSGELACISKKLEVIGLNGNNVAEISHGLKIAFPSLKKIYLHEREYELESMKEDMSRRA